MTTTNEIAVLEKKLELAQAKSLACAARRAALPAGSSRARVTTANANWACAAEHRDRISDFLVKARAAQTVTAVDTPRADIATGSTLTLGRQTCTVSSVGARAASGTAAAPWASFLRHNFVFAIASTSIRIHTVFMTTTNTEQVVAVLKAAGLVAAIDTRRTHRAGFSVRQFSRIEVGISSVNMTSYEWLTAMSALEAAEFAFTYRSDPGMGARVRRSASTV